MHRSWVECSVMPLWSHLGAAAAALIFLKAPYATVGAAAVLGSNTIAVVSECPLLQLQSGLVLGLFGAGLIMIRLRSFR